MSSRPARPEDMPRIRELVKEQNTFVSQPFVGLPDLEADGVRDGERLKRPVYLLEMWVVERDGEIVNAFYLEKCLEFCIVGRDPRGAAEAKRIQMEAFRLAQAAGFRAIHSFIPPEFIDDVAKHLDDMQFHETGYLHAKLRLK